MLNKKIISCLVVSLIISGGATTQVFGANNNINTGYNLNEINQTTTEAVFLPINFYYHYDTSYSSFGSNNSGPVAACNILSALSQLYATDPSMTLTSVLPDQDYSDLCQRIGYNGSIARPSGQQVSDGLVSFVKSKGYNNIISNKINGDEILGIKNAINNGHPLLLSGTGQYDREYVVIGYYYNNNQFYAATCSGIYGDYTVININIPYDNTLGDVWEVYMN
ncbi:MAG: hypothetical protein RR489_05310 [Clostridia bacterium]